MSQLQGVGTLVARQCMFKIGKKNNINKEYQKNQAIVQPNLQNQETQWHSLHSPYYLPQYQKRYLHSTTIKKCDMHMQAPPSICRIIALPLSIFKQYPRGDMASSHSQRTKLVGARQRQYQNQEKSSQSMVR